MLVAKEKVVQVDDIRVFIPSKDYETSKSFYQALGFKMDYVSDDLSLFENGDCFFFLQRFYNHDLANNLVLQLSVLDINEAHERIKCLQGFDFKYNPIQEERWGKVIFLWGPSGELWQITEFTGN
nr:lactoylglutathione lyase [Pseudoalteromonas sp. OOF1S-7]